MSLYLSVAPRSEYIGVLGGQGRNLVGKDVCSGPARKVGFGIAEDLGQRESPGAFGRHVETCGNVSLVGKLSKSFPSLTAAACAAPLSDLRDVEALPGVVCSLSISQH